jgi:hypothetical protein
MFQCDNAALETFHGKGRHGSHGDGVNAVGIAVEIGFQNPMRIKYPGVGPQAGGVFIFRAVHNNALTFVRAATQKKIIGGLGAGHGAAMPAAVGNVLSDVIIAELVGSNLLCIRVAAVLVIVCRQKIVFIHDLDDICGAYSPHLVLAFIVLGHFSV